MSPRVLIPLSFIGLMAQIIICALILQMQSKYPPYEAANITLIAGCSLILLCVIIQISFIVSGINLPSNRILFENALCNVSSALLLLWFALSLWSSSYILYIWGFLSLYPLLNDLVGLIKVRYNAGRFHKFTIE